MESLLRRSPERVLLKPFTLEELIARVVFLLRGG
jgi:DNA-binding response OmpR family regulator